MIHPFHLRSRNRTARRRFRQMFTSCSERLVLLMSRACRAWFVTPMPMSSVTLLGTYWRVVSRRTLRDARLSILSGSEKTTRKGFRFPFEPILSEGVVEMKTFNFPLCLFTSDCNIRVRLNTIHLCLVIFWQSRVDIMSLSPSEIFLEFFDCSVRMMLTLIVPRDSGNAWICNSAFRNILLPLKLTGDRLNWSEMLLSSSLRSVENRSWKQTNKLASS